MGNEKFLLLPQIELSEEPVDWKAEQLSEWLQGLSVSDLEKSCEKICRVILRLTRDELKLEFRLQLLDTIHRYVRLFDSRVDAFYLDTPLPLAEDQQHCVEWLIWCYNSLAEAYLSIATSMETGDGKAGALYLALHAMTNSYQQMAAVYYEPPEGFWLACYQVYAVALREGLLECILKTEENRETSINQLFKLLLVFYLCDLQQFRPREMRKLFVFLAQFADRLQISQVSGGYIKGMFAVDFGQDMPPVSLLRQAGLQQSPATQFIDAASLAKEIHQVLQQGRGDSRLHKGLNSALLMRAIKTLAQVQMRQYKRMAEQRQFRGMIGFSKIRDYLFREEKTEECSTTKTKPKSTAFGYDTSRFELVSQREEGIYLMTESLRKPSANDAIINKILTASLGGSELGKIWGATELESGQDVGEINEFQILNSSAKGYGIAVTHQHGGVKVGDLLAILTESSTATELAIIRRIRRMDAARLNLGVELIGIAEKALLIQGQKKQTKGILLPAMKSIQPADTLIYSSSDFKVGEIVTLKQGNQNIVCRLDKMVNSTLSFNQVELSYLAGPQKN